MRRTVLIDKKTNMLLKIGCQLNSFQVRSN
nr:MAG TPA: hypothetical protein [Caudoviricetes sp.]